MTNPTHNSSPSRALCDFPAAVAPVKRPRGRPPKPRPAPGETPTVSRRDDSHSTEEELSASDNYYGTIPQTLDRIGVAIGLPSRERDLLASSSDVSRSDAAEPRPAPKKRRITPEAEIVVFQKRNSPPVSVKKEPSPTPSESSGLSSVSDSSSSSDSSNHDAEVKKVKEAIPHPDGESCFECGAETSTSWRTLAKRTYCLRCGMKMVRKSRTPKDEEPTVPEPRRRSSPKLSTPKPRVRAARKPSDPSIPAPAKRIRKRKKKNLIRWILPKWDGDWDEYWALFELSEVARWFLG